MLTEDNDENDLIGRPGQYDAATSVAGVELGRARTGDAAEDRAVRQPVPPGYLK